MVERTMATAEVMHIRMAIAPNVSTAMKKRIAAVESMRHQCYLNKHMADGATAKKTMEDTNPHT